MRNLNLNFHNFLNKMSNSQSPKKNEKEISTSSKLLNKKRLQKYDEEEEELDIKNFDIKKFESVEQIEAQIEALSKKKKELLQKNDYFFKMPPEINDYIKKENNIFCFVVLPCLPKKKEDLPKHIREDPEGPQKGIQKILKNFLTSYIQYVTKKKEIDSGIIYEPKFINDNILFIKTEKKFVLEKKYEHQNPQYKGKEKNPDYKSNFLTFKMFRVRAPEEKGFLEDVKQFLK